MTEYLGALSLMALCFAALGAWISRRLGKVADSYLSEKAKNLATKKDIGNLTRIVEDVKIEYSTLIETIRSRNSLKMAALDKRLEVHQEAVKLCIETTRKLANEQETLEHLHKLGQFYINNCIYLNKVASKAFWDSYSAAGLYHVMLDSSKQTQHPDEIQKVKQLRDQIYKAPNIIIAEFELPPMSDKDVQGPRK